MKSYLELIPVSAKVHRRQNRMTLLCIIFAVFLVATVFSVTDMDLRLEKERMIEKHGNWHVSFQNLPESDGEEIAGRSDVAVAAWSGAVNETADIDKTYSIGGKKVILYGAEESYLTEIWKGLTEGNYPENEGEILLSPNVRELLGIWIGDSITVDTPTGSFPFTVSGFCETDSELNDISDSVSAYMDMAAFEKFCAKTGEEFAPELSVRFRQESKVKKNLAEIQQQYGIPEENISENTGVLGVMGFSRNSSMKNMYSLALAVFLMVLAAGVLMIAGSMNSNVTQRTKFFGMMRCIGMSRQQVIRFVRLEAVNWCKTAIPIGIILSIIATWGLCAALRYGVGDDYLEMTVFGISPVGILSGVVTGLVTVLIAAQSPAKRAAKVSPVTAAAGNAENTRKVGHAAHTGILRIETALGIHHAVSAKKNLFLMTGSFAVSILLFLSFSAGIDFVHALLPSLRIWQPDVSIISSDETNHLDRGLVEEIANMPGVAQVFGNMCDTDFPVSCERGIDELVLASYDEYMLECAKEDIVAGSLSGVAGDNGKVLTIYNKDNPIKAGDKLLLGGEEFEVAGALSDGLFGNDVVLICSEETFMRLTGDRGYCMVNVQLTDTANTMEIHALRSLAGEDLFTDQRESNRASNATYWLFQVAVYCFLAIIAMISVLNIINSISMSVSARIRQYGAMRAVGMDGRQLTKMIAAEVFTYTVCGCVVGCVLGIAMNKLLVEVLITSHFGIEWSVPLAEMAVIVLIALAASAAAVYLPSRRIRHMAVTETISEL